MNILLKNDPVVSKAHENYKRFNADEQMREIYFAREKRLKDEASRLFYAKKEGIQEGRQEGRQEGLLSGLLRTAKNMKEMGVDMELIIKATGLEREQIEKR